MTPSVWQSVRFLTRPLDFFQEQVDTHGETFAIRLSGFPTLVMLTAPADLKALFTAPIDVMHTGEANVMAFGPVVGQLTHFVLDGESHLERRRLMLPPFHGDRMHEYGEVMAEVTVTGPGLVAARPSLRRPSGAAADRSPGHPAHGLWSR